jgi:demethylmenaquinone methyltransferase/2-methoxy-6-polyprenyl-1,4-benzoquinol methylase
MTDAEITEILREQRAYYEARAPEYDDGYTRTGLHDRGEEVNQSWRADVDRLERLFDEAPISGDVVELAAGTGYWTERLVGRCRSLCVIDGSSAMLDVHRERLGPRAANVDYQVGDLFEWQPEREWDACVFTFWLSHVPDELIAGFLRAVAASLRPGGAVCFVDKAAGAETAPERVERTLNDGRCFTIIDHHRPAARLVEVFGAAGLDIDVETIGDRFCLGHAIKA